MLQVRSVFSKYCCLSVKLRGFITPLEEQAPFEWLISGPTLPFDSWHSLQALLCSPFPAHEIFTAAVPTETLGQHLCSPLFWFTALTSGIKKQSAREILAPVKLMAKLPPCSKKGDYARWVELDLRKVRFGAGVAPLWPDFCVWEGVLAVPKLCKKAPLRMPVGPTELHLRTGVCSSPCRVLKLSLCICICCSSLVDVGLL